MLVVCASTMFAGGCGGKSAANGRNWNDPAKGLETKPPFVMPGERMTYRVSVYNVELASFTIAVGEPGDLDGHRAIVVQAGAQSSGIAALVKAVRVEFTSWLDVASGEALLFRVVESSGKDDTVEETEARFMQLADGKFPVATKLDDKEVVELQVVQEKPYDLMTLLMSLRAWEGPVGTTRTLEAVRNRYIWRTHVVLAKREAVSTQLGQLPAVRFDAQTRRLMRDGSLDANKEGREFSVWISDDADRVPIRMLAKTDYGDIDIMIVDYAAGRPLTGR